MDGSSIDETDDGGIGKIIHNVQAAVGLVKTEHVLERESEGIAEDDPVDRPMSDNHEISSVLALQDTPKARHHPVGQLADRLSLSRDPKVYGIRHAILDEFREAFANLLEAESFPVTEVKFPKFRMSVDGNVVMLSDQASSCQRSLEIACVDGLNLRKAKPFSEVLKLDQAHFGEGYVGVPINREPLVTLHLPMSDQIDPASLFHDEGIIEGMEDQVNGQPAFFTFGFI
jgi:hypothetical protein